MNGSKDTQAQTTVAEPEPLFRAQFYCRKDLWDVTKIQAIREKVTLPEIITKALECYLADKGEFFQ